MKPSTKYISIIAIGIVIGLIIMYVGAKSPKNSFFDRMIGNISILPIFFLGFGVFISIVIWDRTLENMQRDSILKLVDRLFNDLGKTLTSYYPKAPNLIDSLFLPWQQKPMGETISSAAGQSPDKSNLKTDQWTAVNYVSLRIFQAWEDFLTINNADNTGAEMWINIFIPYANSKILYDIWQVYRTGYDQSTVMLGDYLFQNVLPDPPKNSEEILALTKKIINSKKYKDIVIQRSKILS